MRAIKPPFLHTPRDKQQLLPIAAIDICIVCDFVSICIILVKDNILVFYFGDFAFILFYVESRGSFTAGVIKNVIEEILS